MEAGIEAILKTLPNLAGMGTAGLIIFAGLIVAFVAYKIAMWRIKKPTSGQEHSDVITDISEKHDAENPAANDSLKKDQDAIKDLLD